MMRCAIWFFYVPQKIHILFQSFLELMTLLTVSYLRCPLINLWGVAWYNPPLCLLSLWEVLFLWSIHLICNLTVFSGDMWRVLCHDHSTYRLIVLERRSVAFYEGKCESFGWLSLACISLRNGWVKVCTFADISGASHDIHRLTYISLPLSFSLLSLLSQKSMGENGRCNNKRILLT